METNTEKILLDILNVKINQNHILTCIAELISLKLLSEPKNPYIATEVIEVINRCRQYDDVKYSGVTDVEINRITQFLKEQYNDKDSL